MRMSGPILVLSSALALIFLTIWLRGSTPESEPKPGDHTPASATLSRKDQIRQLLSGEFKRQPKKNPVEGEGRVRGIVTDQGGARVAGANVQVSPCEADLNLAAPRRPQPYYWEGTTKASGYVEFRTLPEGDFVVLATRGNEHGLARVKVAAGGAFAEAFIVLWPNVPRAGAVQDPDGVPVEGALVAPIHAPDWIGDSKDYRYLPAVTDEEGQFQHPFLPEGTWRLLVVARGFAPALVEPDADGAYTAILDQGADLAGRAMREEDGRPLSNTRIVAAAKDEPGESHATRTGGQGQFSFSALRPADYRIEIDSDRFAGTMDVRVARTPAEAGEAATPAARNMVIDPLSGTAVATPASTVLEGAPEPAPATAPELRARALGSLRGRVFDQGGELGVAGAGVRAIRKGAIEPVVTVKTDRAGFYHLAGLEPGDVVVDVSREGGRVFVAEGSPEVAVEGSYRQPGPDFRAAPAVSLYGQVLDARGDPVEGANVTVSFSDAYRKPVVAGTDASGNFEIGAMHELDQVLLRASKLGANSSDFGPVTIGPTGLRAILLRLVSP